MKLSIDTLEILATGRERAWLQKCRLGLTGAAVWAAAWTLQPGSPSAVAAPPIRPHQHATASQSHVVSGHARVPHTAVASASKHQHSGGCSVCGKKRRNLMSKLLDGVTAGTDWLIFGSSYQGTCDCDSGCDTAGDLTGCDTACDAIGLSPYPYGNDPHRGPGRFAPQPIAPGIELLPAPVHQPPVPPRGVGRNPAEPGQKPAVTPERLSPERPTTRANLDQHLDPFGDDPIYQGTNPAISRSAYYE